MKSVLSFIFSLIILVSVWSPAPAQVKAPRESALDRFLRYVKIDTQSKEDQDTVISRTAVWTKKKRCCAKW